MRASVRTGEMSSSTGDAQSGVDLGRLVAVRMARVHRPVGRDGVAQAVGLALAPVGRQHRREVVLVGVALIPLAAQANEQVEISSWQCRELAAACQMATATDAPHTGYMPLVGRVCRLLRIKDRAGLKGSGMRTPCRTSRMLRAVRTSTEQ